MTPDEIAARDRTLGIFWHLAPQRAPAPESGAFGNGSELAALTLAVKDNVDVAGMPTTAGLAAYANRIATRDAACVAGLRRTGITILGKVAMHEGALGATTDVPRLCHNPVRTGFTPGGSSGGSAAAIAAGFADLAIGTDTMGSVRIPAAYCGVFGLKPTAGLVSRRGVVPLSPALDHVGILAATPRLAAQGLEAMVGDDPTDPASRPTPDGWHAVPRTPTELRSLRVGLPRPVVEAPMEDAVRATWEEMIALICDSGGMVETVEVPGWDPSPVRRAGLLRIEAEAAALHEALIDDPAAATPAFRAALDYGRKLGAIRLARAQFRLDEARAGILRALDACDLLLLPTAPQRAFAHGTLAPADQADFCAIANIAGLPALAMPWPGEGLPRSLQLLGRPHAEAELIAFAMAALAP